MKTKKSGIGRTIARVLILVVLGSVAGLGVYGWTAGNLTGDRMPMPFGIGASVVLSGSMEPELSVNDLIIVKATDNFYEEQIVVFRDGRSLTVHRIKEIHEDTVVTKGDANNSNDDPISKDAIKGEVIAVIPGVGKLTEVMQTPAVVVVILGVALFLLELSYRSEREKKKEDLTDIENEIRALVKELKESTPDQDQNQAQDKDKNDKAD